MIGQDRPGLVEAVASLVAEHQGNWLESRMSRLGGHFAGILRVEVPAAEVPALKTALTGLQARGLAVTVHAGQPAAPVPAARLASLEIVGHDRPGIVRQITHALASHAVNVEQLETECASAAMSGELLFKARANLAIPPATDLEALRAQLEKIAEDLIVDITFTEIG